MRVRVDGRPPEYVSAEPIDAHSAAAGDYTHERKVNGQAVFLTEAGATAFDALRQSIRENDVEISIVAEQDPNTLFQKVAKLFTLKVGSDDLHQGSR